MREIFIDNIDGFSEFPSEECSASAPGIIGYHNPESFILSAGPKCSLPLAGVSHDGDLVAVYPFLGFQEIDDPARSPCPCADSLPFVGNNSFRIIFRKKRDNTVIP